MTFLIKLFFFNFCWHFLFLFGPELQTGKQNCEECLNSEEKKTSYLGFSEFKIRTLSSYQFCAFILKELVHHSFPVAHPILFPWLLKSQYNRLLILSNH